MRERPSNAHDWSRISLALHPGYRLLARPPTQRKSLVRRAHQRTSMEAAASMVGTAHDSPERMERECPRLCPPYKSGTRLRGHEAGSSGRRSRPTPGVALAETECI